MVTAYDRVSYVVPVLNEERYLEPAVKSILAQAIENFEVILVCGRSTDRTLEIANRLAEEHPSVVVLDNPKSSISAGMNLGLARATSDIVVRVDAHSELPPHYTRRMLKALEESGAVNAGGRMLAVGTSSFESAVAHAYNTRWGLGGGVYHVGGREGPAESAYLGVYERKAVIDVGGYDEALSRGEDWELNLRLRRTGRKVWFVPDVVVTYRPRSSVRALARQFHASGRWRGALIRRAPADVSLRFLVPPALVLALVTSLVLGVAAIVAAPPAASILALLALVAPVLYVCAIASGCVLSRRLSPAVRAWLLIVLPVIHISWGVGCLLGIVTQARGENAFRGR